MSRVAVIGAGIAGMCTAARLASLGHKVDVYENSDKIGGKCRTEWIDDLAFDTGPTLLTLPAVFRDFFLKTGDPLESVLELQPVNPSFDYRFSDGSRVKFSNLSRYETLQAIELSFGANSAHDWSRLMKRASAIWDASRAPFIESELVSIFALLKSPSLLKDIGTIAPWKSLRSLVSHLTDDYRLQYIVDRYATYSGSDPRRAPGALLSIAYVEEAFGAWHVRGGIGQLSTAIFNRAVEHGVQFHLNTTVRKIENNGTRILGLSFTDGNEISADVVVANADASLVYNSLLDRGDALIKKPRKALSKASPSLAGFSMFFGMKGNTTFEALEHHSVLFPNDYEKEFDSIFHRFEPVADPTIYLCSPRDPKMSRTVGRSGVSVLVNAPRHSKTGEGWDWENEIFIENYGNQIIDSIESKGIPIRKTMKLLEVRTPADLEKSTLAPGGSIYGTSSNGAHAAFMRARNRSPLNGLYCVGGSAHPGGGLPLVAISAEIVSNMIGRA